jgi:hypothetical protein
MNGIIIIINLPGTIGAPVKHKDWQKNTVKIEGGTLTRNIFHTDREIKECYKRLPISDTVLEGWVSDTVPSWEEARRWKRMSRSQRIISYVKEFDEGYGVSFDYIS